MKTRNNRYIVLIEGKKIPVDVNKGSIQKIGKTQHEMSLERVDSDEFMVNIDGKQHSGEIIRLKQNKCIVAVNGNTYSFEITSESSHRRTRKIKEQAASAALKLTAPLPGKIMEVMVTPGQKVKKGEALLVLEAMKMQNEIQSPVNGTIKNLNVQAGSPVMKDHILMDIEVE
ncbi:biotin/lipoyl-containing protein [Thermophagus sp. OGC60D27]|uniref:biotin/lipoyl-containing protein n=1 Tax=Thermophagus sp. OGC60D27 TaxID=3458415 RepID=UPI0040381A0E